MRMLLQEVSERRSARSARSGLLRSYDRSFEDKMKGW